jgi:CheY-like chemotaxis protein
MDKTEQKNFSSLSVLVVEDNKVNQLLVKGVLKKFGFARIDTADDGQDAFRKLESNLFDLVLMDIQMPGMDGYEVTRAIRANVNERIRNIPVIALTGDASEKEKQKATQAGMNGYVVKPYTPEELYNTLLKFANPGQAQHQDKEVPGTKTNGMDLAFLAKFTGGDQEMTIQLIEIFLMQVPDAIERIGLLIPEKKWGEIFPIAHKVKSSLAIFEMEEIKNCVISIEEYSRDRIKLESIPTLFEKFKTEGETAVVRLRQELQRLKSLHA